MENKDIEAWFEGVIIGVWRNSWTKPEPMMMQRARQWQIWDLKMGWHRGGGHFMSDH